MKDIYDNYVEHTFGQQEQALFKIEQFRKNYEKYFPVNLDSYVLDIGIGRGEMLTCMKMWGFKNYLGVDISPSTISFCKNLGLNCEIINNTSEYLKQNPNKFSLITLLDVLEHFSKDEIIPFLKDLKGALSEHGVLIIQVPNLQAPDSQLHRYNDFTHQVGFIEHSFSQVLLAAGFEAFKFYGFEQFVFGTFVERIRKIAREIHWALVRLSRGIDGNLNPRILHPVFYVVIDGRESSPK